MKKVLYCLLGCGISLLCAACSDDKAPISAELPTPDNLVRTSAEERCVISDPNHPDDSLHGCYYSSELWNRHSGYRVQTGYDNGTNTSGVWFWSLNAANGRKVQVNWNQNSDARYDSMSLSSVIDRCNGSLCGVIVFDAVEDSSSAVPGSSSFSVEFSFAGKNASGKFETVNVRDMQGICLEYFADAMRMELNLGDSLNALMDGDFYGVDLPSYPVLGAQGKSEGNKICYPWEQFVLSKAGVADGAPSIEEAVSHLQGLRFTMSSTQGYAFIDNFDIISLGRYSSTPVGTVTALPVDEHCEAVLVKDYFCESSYPDDRAEIDGYFLSRSYIREKVTLAKNSEDLMSAATEKCLGKLEQESADIFTKIRDWNADCYNPRPKTLVCADGSESVSQDFSQTKAAFDARVLEISEREKALQDSLYAVCSSLRDTLFNGEPVPDSCRIDQVLSDRRVDYLDYAAGTYFAASEEFNAMIDSLYRVDSLDEATEYCVVKFLPQASRLSASTQPLMAPPPVLHPLVKKIRCESGNVYYTDEYKEFLQELGIQDDTDSLEVFNAGKEHYLHTLESAFDACVERYAKEGAIWEGVWTRVNTGFDNGTGTSGKWFYETDSAYGGNSYIKWEDDYVVNDWNNPNALDAILLKSGELTGQVHFVKNDSMTEAPFVDLGFWLAGEDGKGGHDAVDITDKKGICFEHDYSDQVAYLQLDMGDSLNEAMKWNLFSVRANPISSIVEDCYAWDQFRQGGWSEKMDLEEALKHVAGIRIHFVGSDSDDKIVNFSIRRIRFLNQ